MVCDLSRYHNWWASSCAGTAVMLQNMPDGELLDAAAEPQISMLVLASALRGFAGPAFVAALLSSSSPSLLLRSAACVTCVLQPWPE